MKKIETRIDTMQLELVEANKEIARHTNCFEGNLLMDVSGNQVVAYPTPEEALAQKGGMIRDAMYYFQDSNLYSKHFLRVSVIVDVFHRDSTDPRFSPCDATEIDRALYEHYEKENEPVTPMVWHSIESGLPNENLTVLVITDKDTCFFGRYNEKKKLFISSSCKDIDYTDAGIPKYWAELPTIKTK